MNDTPNPTTADPWLYACAVCGIALPASCPADEGYGCPAWETFKERRPEYKEQEP